MDAALFCEAKYPDPLLRLSAALPPTSFNGGMFNLGPAKATVRASRRG